MTSHSTDIWDLLLIFDGLGLMSEMEVICPATVICPYLKGKRGRNHRLSGIYVHTCI